MGLYTIKVSDVPDLEGRLPDDTLGNTSQMPNFPSGLDLSESADWDVLIRRTPGSLGSLRFTADLEKRWHNNDYSYWTNRNQHTVPNVLLQAIETWFSFSLFFPEGYEDDDHEEIVFNFRGDGGGAFSVRINSGNFVISIGRLDENTTTNRLLFVLERATSGRWHDFVCYARWSISTEKGRLTVWKDGQLARLYSPVTNEKWEIPTILTSGIQSQYTAFSAKGYINQTVEEDGQTIDVLDWKGFTYGLDETTGMGATLWRPGYYKSGWNTNYDSVTGEIEPGTYMEHDPLYIKPSLRIRTMWTANVNFQPIDSPMGQLTDEVSYKSMDAEGELPNEVPNWWKDGIVQIVSPLPETDFFLGSPITILTDVREGTVEFYVNQGLIAVKNSPPYSHNFIAGESTIDDSLLHFKFNGNVIDSSLEGNVATIINPSNASYVVGREGQAISLGNSGVQSQKSYVSIPTSQKLEDVREFTIAYWIKAERGIGHRIFSNNLPASTGIDIQILSDGRTDLWLNRGVSGESHSLRSSPNVSGGALVDENTWNHFLWTYDNDVLKCYYNGSLRSQSQIGPIDAASTSEWRINASQGGNSKGDGIYEDFLVYDYAFSEKQVKELLQESPLGPVSLMAKKDGAMSDFIIVNIV